MWPDAGWAEALSTLQRPLTPPNVDPDANPALTVSINCSWLPYVRGALWALVEQATWNASGAALTQAQMRAMTLISMFQECSSPPAISCPYDWTASGSTQDGYNRVPEPGYSPPGMGVFLSSVGWQDSVMVNAGTGLEIRGIELDNPLASAIIIDAFVLDFSVVFGNRSGGIGGPGAIQAYSGGTLVASASINLNTAPNGFYTLTYSGPHINVDRFHIDLRCGEKNGADPGGTLQLTRWGYNKVSGGC